MTNATSVSGLDLRGLKEHLRSLLGNNKPGVKVGIMEDATSADYGPIAPIAAIHEFGAPAAGIPPRSFMRSTAATKRTEWVNDAAALLANSLDAQGVQAALAEVGEAMAKDIQMAIQQGIDPALKPRTVAAKAKKGAYEPDLPLVATGALMQSISSEYVDDVTKVGG